MAADSVLKRSELWCYAELGLCLGECVCGRCDTTGKSQLLSRFRLRLWESSREFLLPGARSEENPDANVDYLSVSEQAECVCLAGSDVRFANDQQRPTNDCRSHPLKSVGYGA